MAGLIVVGPDPTLKTELRGERRLGLITPGDGNRGNILALGPSRPRSVPRTGGPRGPTGPSEMDMRS